MADLREMAPHQGLDLPVVQEDCRLSALPLTRIAAISPYPGRSAEVAEVLGGFPGPGQVLHTQSGRLLWAGRETAFLFGAPPDLSGIAAVTEQSDGWAGLLLEGEQSADILARLVPLDLAGFTAPGSARSLLNHLPLLLIHLAAGRYEIWSYRSMTGSMVHELAAAMQGVAARRALSTG